MERPNLRKRLALISSSQIHFQLAVGLADPQAPVDDGDEHLVAARLAQDALRDGQAAVRGGERRREEDGGGGERAHARPHGMNVFLRVRPGSGDADGGAEDEVEPAGDGDGRRRGQRQLGMVREREDAGDGGERGDGEGEVEGGARAREERDAPAATSRPAITYGTVPSGWWPPMPLTASPPRAM